MSENFVKRILKINPPRSRSAFLWGPRKTGKTTILKQQFSEALWIDLLDYNVYFNFNKNPAQLREVISFSKNKNTVVIDEVQKIPALMDEIQWNIQNRRNIQFILCGSSARKLKRNNVGLMGGRALRYELFPLVSKEIGIDSINLDKILLYGMIPAHYFSGDPEMELKSYVNDYLKEEIQMEALTRNLSVFSKFLYSAALTNGMLLNYSNIARECGVSVKTVREYYTILEDTLIGRQIFPWRKSKKRRLIETSKFFFFDVGILTPLLGRKNLHPGTMEYGIAFEHFILQECWAYSRYSKTDFPLYFYKTASGNEVDMILGEGEVAVEIKSSENSNYKLKGLHIFSEESKPRKKIVVSRELFPRKLENGVEVWPWKEFLKALWDGDIIN